MASAKRRGAWNVWRDLSGQLTQLLKSQRGGDENDGEPVAREWSDGESRCPSCHKKLKPEQFRIVYQGDPEAEEPINPFVGAVREALGFTKLEPWQDVLRIACRRLIAEGLTEEKKFEFLAICEQEGLDDEVPRTNESNLDSKGQAIPPPGK